MISKKIKNEKTRIDLFHLVSYFEYLSIAVTHNYCDNDIAKSLMENVVISTYKSLLPYIIIRRQETNNKGIASNIEDLASKWSKRQDN